MAIMKTPVSFSGYHRALGQLPDDGKQPGCQNPLIPIVGVVAGAIAGLALAALVAWLFAVVVLP